MFLQSCVVVGILLLTPRETLLYVAPRDTSVAPFDPDLEIRKLSRNGRAPHVLKFGPLPRLGGIFPPCQVLASDPEVKYAET